jgi:peptidoglycan/xylan/chitin deacetylase (PgdA/CDA1 family)
VRTKTILQFLILAASAACSNPPTNTGTDVDAAPPGADAQVPLTPYTNLTVSLTFDDTFADQYQVRSLLSQRGMHATFYVNSSRVGLNAGYMSISQLKDLVADGNEIGGHTLNHNHLTQDTPDVAYQEICGDRAGLVNLGFNPTTFAYPFGDENADIKAMAQSCGYSSARTIGGLLDPATCSRCAPGNAMPPADTMLLKTNGSVKTENTDKTIEDYLVQYSEAGGGWTPIVFHRVCDDCNTNSITVDELGRLMDWLKAHQVTVKTVSAVMGQ